jgi:hypothetical protein
MEDPLAAQVDLVLYIMRFGSKQFHHAPLLLILTCQILVYAAFSWNNVITCTTTLDIVVPLITLPKRCLYI